MVRKDICFICSSGGHYSELKTLFKLSNLYNSFIVTEEGNDSECLRFNKTYFFKETNRKEFFFFIKLIYLFVRMFIIYILERPRVIITTGALISYPMCLIGHLFGSKIVYIESFARVNSLSSTGKRIYPIADLFFVQWKQLVDKYPRCKYVGNLFGDAFL